MTLAQAIGATQAVKPHQYDAATLARWISDLDGKVWQEIFQGRNGAPPMPPLPYDPGQQEQPLLIPFPYEDIYVKYLSMQIDYHNAEFGRYNNGLMMFRMQYQAFADWVERTQAGRGGKGLRMPYGG